MPVGWIGFDQGPRVIPNNPYLKNMNLPVHPDFQSLKAESTWPIEKINQQMNALTLHGKLTAKPGKGAALADLLLRAADLVSEAKGCRLYLISQDPEAPENIWVTEVWDSAEDHQASLQIPAVRALIEEAMPLLDGQPQRGQRLTMLDGHGLKTGH
jgi:quinol monooxygenase YgiN